MIEHIPLEMQSLPQWVAAGDNKVPINPRTGDPADPTNPATWGTFAEATRTGLKFVGFVLSKDDPFTIIDLDDPFSRKDKTKIQQGDPDYDEALDRVKRHAKFLELFDSYTEISQSGQGMHIVCRGHIPKGVRRDKVEIYSEARYMICTGNVYRDAPIADRQELLSRAFAEMNTTAEVTELVQVEGAMSDLEVTQMAMSASNADKFNDLCCGRWEEMGLYSSQSEADLALMTIFAFYTRDNEQVRRLFRMSALGKREKALRDDYLNYALAKIRAKQPPLIDLSLLAPAPVEVQTELALEPSNVEETPETYTRDQLEFPPGLLGEIAEFTLGYAVRPVREIALATAIALVAGIVGRSYNVSNTGLNQYVILLARTGSGKEAIAQSIDALISNVRMNVPAADMFIGPAAFASGQALIKALDGAPCFVSVLGEVGITLQQISHPRANSAEVMLKKVLLDLYGKSGWHQTLRSTVYSDKDKNTRTVQAPNLTIIGESTPEEFYDGLSEEQVASGLIPRFLVLEYTGPRPAENERPFTPPTESLLSKLRDLTAIAVTTSQNATNAPVSIDSEARKLLKEFNRYVDKQFDSNTRESTLQIWNRAHLKALKLAGLVAVGCNPHSPTVTAEVAQWAISFVKRDVQSVLSRFQSGNVGRGHAKQYHEVVALMEEYFAMPVHKRKNYKAPEGVLDKQIVPLAYLTTRVRGLRSFNELANRTSRQVLEQILQEMLETELIDRIALDQAKAAYSTRTPLYVPGPRWSSSGAASLSFPRETH